MYDIHATFRLPERTFGVDLEGSGARVACRARVDTRIQDVVCACAVC